MKFLLLILVVLLGLLLGAGFYLVRRLKRLARSPEVRALGESLDAGLTIPMRDCDTRRLARRDTGGRRS